MNTIKIILIIIFVTIASLMPIYVLASYKKVPLVLDMQNAPKVPHRFRSTLNLPQTENDDINWHGLKELKMAGSAQFSKLSLEKILKQLHTTNLTVVDLRQESHGFLNGNAVCWYGHRADLNAGKSDQEIEDDQAARLNNLSDSGSVFVNKNPGLLRNKQIEYALHSKCSEATLVQSFPLEYRRVYVQNYHAPNEIQVDRFIDIIKNLRKNSWVYFHCRAGLGRTTTFMAMYDMMHNAKSVSFQDILKRQAALGGKNLNHLPSKHSFKYRFAEKRLEFLHSFYDYAKQNDDNFATLYSTWMKRKGDGANL